MIFGSLDFRIISRNSSRPSDASSNSFPFLAIISFASQINPEPKKRPRWFASFKARKIIRVSFSRSDPSFKTIFPFIT